MDEDSLKKLLENAREHRMDVEEAFAEGKNAPLRI
jgi:hypothetical protein